MIKNISYFYLHYILKNPLYAIMFLLIILAGMMTFASNFKLDASADSLILENDKDLVKYRNTISKYDTKELCAEIEYRLGSLDLNQLCICLSVVGKYCMVM